MDPDFVERRRAALEVFLCRCAANSTLCYDRVFLAFLQQDDSWRDACKESGNLF